MAPGRAGRRRLRGTELYEKKGGIFLYQLYCSLHKQIFESNTRRTFTHVNTKVRFQEIERLLLLAAIIENITGMK